MASPSGPRAAATRALHAVVVEGRSLDAALAGEAGSCRAEDRGLLGELAFGGVRWHFLLAALLESLLNRPLARRDRIVNSLIEIGLYQLWQLRVPDHAAVSETVAACAELGRPRLRGLVNAVLRRFQREREALLREAMREPATALSHPPWLLDRLAADWPGRWREIAEANNQRAPMWLRVNLDRITSADWRRQLPADVSAELLPGVPSALRLSRPLPAAELPGLDTGLVSVQDGAAQIAALLLEPGPGMRVLDACAAPGGKSTHILEATGGRARLTAVDADADRLASVGSGLSRAGYEADLVHGDASAPAAWWDGEPYQRILVDAPCSASGVIRRHPDIKILRRAKDIAVLSRRQRAMLDALWPLLAPGGRLVYATCSVLRAENAAVIEDFLASVPEALVAKTLRDDNIRDLMQAEGEGFQLFPGRFALDGFFYCCIKKPT